MGYQVDLNSPMSDEDKAYLRSRGRSYLVEVNERRFGVDGTREPEAHEQAGGAANSPFYDSDERAKAVYDVGGAPLPGVTLDYNTGRVQDRDNGQLLEYTGPGHTPGAHDLSSVRGAYEEEGFTSYDVDENGNPVDDDIDDRIVHEVISIPNVKALRARLTKEGVSFAGDDKREELENKLAIHLDDKRRAGEYEPKPIEADDAEESKTDDSEIINESE